MSTNYVEFPRKAKLLSLTSLQQEKEKRTMVFYQIRRKWFLSRKKEPWSICQECRIPGVSRVQAPSWWFLCRGRIWSREWKIKKKNRIVYISRELHWKTEQLQMICSRSLSVIPGNCTWPQMFPKPGLHYLELQSNWVPFTSFICQHLLVTTNCAGCWGQGSKCLLSQTHTLVQAKAVKQRALIGRDKW